MITTNENTLAKYADEWSMKMVDIWLEKIRMLDIYDTGALYNSVESLSVSALGGQTLIPHRFIEYGLYVDAGVGKGFKRGNGGDLGFTPVRQPRPWYHIKYYASFMVLRDAVTDIYGKESARRITMGLNGR